MPRYTVEVMVEADSHSEVMEAVIDKLNAGGQPESVMITHDDNGYNTEDVTAEVLEAERIANS